MSEETCTTCLYFQGVESCSRWPGALPGEKACNEYQHDNEKVDPKEQLAEANAKIKELETELAFTNNVEKINKVGRNNLANEIKAYREALEKYADAENWMESGKSKLDVDDLWMGNSSNGNWIAKHVLETRGQS